MQPQQEIVKVWFCRFFLIKIVLFFFEKKYIFVVVRNLAKSYIDLYNILYIICYAIMRGNMMRRKTCFGTILILFMVVNIVLSFSGAGMKKDHILLNQILDPQVYPSTPDWESDNPHYSTGSALADINQDGWLDLVVADGNDMLLGRLNVYYNNNGAFPTTASWQSDDSAYNGHLDVADVNGDGWPDVAVSHLGEFSTTGPIARLYLNNEGTLSSVPDWSSDVMGNAFGVDFGDMNNDGRPDLAVATGWSYPPQHFYHNYVYLNIGGMLESTASWESDDIYHYQGVLWVDADDDGWLDYVGTGTGQDIKIYRNLGGMLETTASWQTSDSGGQDGIMLTTGDINNDGILDLFATDNTQLSGSGRFKQYLGLSSGFFETSYSWSFYDGYGSAVALADVNGDSKLDLATGAWWDNTRIFFNDGDGLPTSPSWNSQGTSVVEKIVFGDVGPQLNEYLLTESYDPNGDCKLFYLPHQPIQGIISVSLDGEELDPSEYTFSREHGWFTTVIAPTDSIEVEYTYSNSLDMIVSNWDSDIGNYLYYNQFFEDNLECSGSLNWNDVEPGSTVTGEITVQNLGMAGSELDWEIELYPDWGTWSFSPNNGLDLTPEDGAITVYVEVVAPDDPNEEFEGEIKIVNSNNPYDFCIISAALVTPRIQKGHMTNLQMGNQQGLLVKR